MPWRRRARPPPGWAGRTAYNRGQILYRFAEALESRRADIGAPADEVGEAIDVLVHYAGWTDKFQPVLGGINPVAAPFLSFSQPEPTGAVGLVAPDKPELLGLVAELAPVLAAGNTLGRGAIREGAAARPRPRRGARHRRRAGRRCEPAVRAAAASWPRRSPATTR